MIGSVKHYTEAELAGVPCARCGAPSTQQWAICANGNRWLGCCSECDVRLNRLALEFMRVPEVETLLRQYREKIDA